MVAYLLCAGFGTRMQPLTNDTPKSLLPVNGQPLLDHLMTALRDWRALDAVHVAVNHRDADAFRTWAADWKAPLEEENITLHIHDDGVASTDEQLGALGDLQFLIDETGLPDDGALVSGGDSLYRFPLAPILNAFGGSDNQVLALHEPDVERRRQSSILQLDGRRVTGLVEDPADADTTRICPSFHLLTPAALAYVDSYLDSGRDADTLGTFVHALSRWQIVQAVRLPEQPHLRLHCNTPDDLDRTRRLLNDEPLHLLDDDAVEACL
jgi:NDP-sugar pyrophosphorylase family protein